MDERRRGGGRTVISLLVAVTVVVVLFGLWSVGHSRNRAGEEISVVPSPSVSIEKNECTPTDEELDELIVNPEAETITVVFPQEFLFATQGSREETLSQHAQEYKDLPNWWAGKVEEIPAENALALTFTQAQLRQQLTWLMTNACSDDARYSSDYRHATLDVERSDIENFGWRVAIEMQKAEIHMVEMQLLAGYPSYEWHLDLADQSSGAVVWSFDSVSEDGKIVEYQGQGDATGNYVDGLVLNEGEVAVTADYWNSLFDAAGAP